MSEMTPREIVHELDRHIIGQQDAKRAVAIAKKLGYENARSLNGGMGAWRAANLPVEK